MQSVGRMKAKMRNLYTRSCDWNFFLQQSADVLKVPQCKPHQWFWPLDCWPRAHSVTLHPLESSRSGQSRQLQIASLGSLELPLTSTFPHGQHRLFLGNLNWLLAFSPLMRGTTEFGFWWTLSNFFFVMYAKFPSRKQIGSSNLLRNTHTVCRNLW